MNTQDFLNGLDKLTFVKYENKTFYTVEGFEISYEIELNGGAITKYPLQFIFRVRKDNTHVMSWGCESNDDNIISNIWWQKKEAEINKEKYKLEDIKRVKLKNEFNKIINI